MRPILALSLVAGLAHGAVATKITYKPVKSYPSYSDVNGKETRGIFPKGFTVSLTKKTKQLTITSLDNPSLKFKAKLDPKYKPRDARFKGFSMFRGEVRDQRGGWYETREVLFNLSALGTTTAHLRFHGDQWGGVETFKTQK
jgi:hypothetical protein